MRVLVFIFAVPLAVLMVLGMFWVFSWIMLLPIIFPVGFALDPKINIPFVYGFIGYNGIGILGCFTCPYSANGYDEALWIGLVQFFIGVVCYFAYHGMPMV